MPRPRQFDADAKTKELLDSPITIGERTFYPARVTPDVRRDQIAIQVNNAKLIREDALDQDAAAADTVTPEQLAKRAEGIEQLDNAVYAQIAVLIRDEDKNAPDVEFLTSHLDQRVARELLTWLEESYGEEGEAEQATTPAATGP